MAVNTAGVRIGKGGGYADLEFALLVELGMDAVHGVVSATVSYTYTDTKVLDAGFGEDVECDQKSFTDADGV